MARTEFCGSPSSVRHELWTYSLILCEAPRAQPNQGRVSTSNDRRHTKNVRRPIFVVSRTIPYSRVRLATKLRITQKGQILWLKERLSPADSLRQVAYNLT